MARRSNEASVWEAARSWRASFPISRRIPLLKLRLAAGCQRMLDAAHHVAAETGLGVQRRLHAEHVPGGQIEELGHECRRAHVDRDAQSFLRREHELRIVHQDRRIPLAQLDHQVFLEAALAGKAPPIGDLMIAQEGALRVVRGSAPLEHAHPATAAAAVAAARKLDALLEEQVAKRRALRRRQLGAGWAEDDARHLGAQRNGTPGLDVAGRGRRAGESSRCAVPMRWMGQGALLAAYAVIAPKFASRVSRVVSHPGPTM